MYLNNPALWNPGNFKKSHHFFFTDLMFFSCPPSQKVFIELFNKLAGECLE